MSRNDRKKVSLMLSFLLLYVRQVNTTTWSRKGWKDRSDKLKISDTIFLLRSFYYWQNQLLWLSLCYKIRVIRNWSENMRNVYGKCNYFEFTYIYCALEGQGRYVRNIAYLWSNLGIIISFKFVAVSTRSITV